MHNKIKWHNTYVSYSLDVKQWLQSYHQMKASVSGAYLWIAAQVEA